MPLDETRAAFAAAAAQDGLVLEPASFDWYCEQGHVGLERVAKARRDPAIVAPVVSALATLRAIFTRLRGDPTVLPAARENLLLPVDLVHGPTGVIVAVDGPEHLTSHRLAALELYPAELDVEQAKALCRELGPRVDSIQRGLAAKAFGFGGVPRERAYHDSLLDLGAPAMGCPPVLRIAAVDGDGAAAYARTRRAAQLRGGCSWSVSATLTVLQRPQRTRTLRVM